MSQLEILIYVSLISADSETLTEEEKQALISRYDGVAPPKDWGYILQPIKDEDKRNKLIELMESAQREEIKQENDTLPEESDWGVDGDRSGAV